jgi:8-oxo-dGTP pyrophosphatase MutT (NUDIX family)/REP element-mobilizing transposase RayT
VSRERAGDTGFQLVSETGVPPVQSPTHFVPYHPDGQTAVSRRNLPHWSQDGVTYFLTWRLADSLPAHLVRQWKEEREVWLHHHPKPWSGKDVAEYEARFIRRRQEWLDQGHGACVLMLPVAARAMVETLQHFDGKRYLLDHYVVMPNHVHVLVKPLPGNDLQAILHSWKSFSSKRINVLLGRNGNLWMDESYDRIVRDWAELLRCRDYIAGNPGKAGLHAGHYLLGTMSKLTFDADSGPESGGTPDAPTGWKPVPPFPLCEIRDHDDWKKLPGEMVYPGKYVQIEECAYLTPARPETPVHWTVAHRKSAIAVAPITDDGKFILIHQERLPVQRTLWEFPAGQLDDGETHEAILDTVHRELDEEAGCVVAPEGTLTPLGWFFGSQGFTNEHVYLFAAHPVRIVRTPQPVGGEHIGEVRLVTGAELRQMVASHVIQDALTLALFARMAAHGMV